MDIIRICKKCNIEKYLTDFSKSPECKLGFRYECKECRNKRVAKGPCTENPSWFKKGHELVPGSEKGWFKKGSNGSQAQRGKKPHNYIDGNYRLKAKQIRKNFQGPKAQRCRLKVLERDGFKCMRCHEHNVKLHIHHIIPLRVDASKAYDLDNLITLCPKCHAQEERNITVV